MGRINSLGFSFLQFRWLLVRLVRLGCPGLEEGWWCGRSTVTFKRLDLGGLSCHRSLLCFPYALPHAIQGHLSIGWRTRSIVVVLFRRGRR